MNSTLQCLYRVPQLRGALRAYSGTPTAGLDTSHKLTVAAKDLFAVLLYQFVSNEQTYT